MAFVCIKGLPGCVYVPQAPAAGAGQHPCRDCFVCQRCGASRCRACRLQGADPDPEKALGPGGRDAPGNLDGER